MTARRPIEVFGIFLAVALAAVPVAGRASKSDAFENKIEPVSGQLYQKAHRFEVTLPSANLSLNDAFFHKYFAGVKAGYHFTEMLYGGATFAAGASSTTGSTSICVQNGGCTAAGDAALFQLPGMIKMMAGGEVAFSPVYGKLNMLAEGVLHFDLSLMAGADWIQYRAGLTPSEAQTLAAAGSKPSDESTFGGHFGVGVRIFLSNSMALRLELKDYIYRATVGTEKDTQNQLFGELGLSFFLPFGYKANP